jgi:hypothetical protein
LSDKHGIERLRWLLAAPTDPTELGIAAGFQFHPGATNMTYLSEREVNVEVAFALIEELHDALLKLDHPVYVMPQSPHGL